MSRFLCRITLFIGIISFLLPGAVPAEETIVKILRVDYRKAEEALPTVKSLLSAEGSAGVDMRTNSLIVVDSPDAVGRIQDFLKDVDQPVEQVTIRVRISEHRLEEGTSASVEGTVGGDGWEAGTGGSRDDAELSGRVEGGRSTLAGVSEYYITASSGSPAYIVTGTSVPYRERLLILSRQHGHVSEGIEFREVETGFDVSPTIVGDHALLDITPRISYLASDNGHGVVRFTEASTSVTVPINQWFLLSGADQSSNEVFLEILAAGRSRQQARVSISLLVEKPT